MSTRRITLAIVITAALLMTSMGCATATVRAEDRPARVEAPKSRASYIAAYLILTALTIADVETTHRALDRCATCYEANPVMRPFVSRGRGATYAVTFGLNAISMEIARRRMERGEPWVLIPVAGSTMHAAAAVSNSQQGNK